MDACLSAAGDYRPEKLNAKIRDAQLELIPFMFITGGREMENQTVSVRDRIEGDLGAMPLDEAIERLLNEVAARTVRRTYSSDAGLSERAAGHEY